MAISLLALLNGSLIGLMKLGERERREMKVKIGKSVDWFGPFQLAEKLLFWMDKDDDQVYNFGHFLVYGTFKDEMIDLFNNDRDETWLYKFLSWVHSKKHRKVKIHKGAK